MGVRVAVMMGVGGGGNHYLMLYYNIEPVHVGSGLPISMAIVAATDGNGTAGRGGSDRRDALGYARRGAYSAQQKGGRNATASLGSSFRDDASAPDLRRCAIAHRGISRFRNAQLRI